MVQISNIRYVANATGGPPQAELSLPRTTAQVASRIAKTRYPPSTFSADSLEFDEARLITRAI